MNTRETPTLVVNLFGAPGAGKSTTRAWLFNQLKLAGRSVEEVTEYAKDLVWENSLETLACQPHVSGEQIRRITRLLNKTDIILTDAPIINGSFYINEYPESHNTFLYDLFSQHHNLNFLIQRNKPYYTLGRMQTEEESNIIGKQIEEKLTKNNVDFMLFPNDSSGWSRMLQEIYNRE